MYTKPVTYSSQRTIAKTTIVVERGGPEKSEQENLRSKGFELGTTVQERKEKTEDPSTAEQISERERLELVWLAKNSPHANQQSRLEPIHKKLEKEFIHNDYNVLIVDDDEDSLLVAQYIVEALGCSVIPVRSGHSVVSAALECCPDIILLDIRLDGINGIDVYKELQQHEQLADVPVIAVTALAHPSERSAAIAAGFSGFLLKPYLANDLYEAISSYLPD